MKSSIKIYKRSPHGSKLSLSPSTFHIYLPLRTFLLLRPNLFDIVEPQNRSSRNLRVAQLSHHISRLLAREHRMRWWLDLENKNKQSLI